MPDAAPRGGVPGDPRYGGAPTDRPYGSEAGNGTYGAPSNGRPYGDTPPDRPYGSAPADRPYGSARADQPYGSAPADQPYGSPPTDRPRGSAAGDPPYSIPTDRPYGRAGGSGPYGAPATERPYSAPPGDAPYGGTARVALPDEGPYGGASRSQPGNMPRSGVPGPAYGSAPTSSLPSTGYGSAPGSSSPGTGYGSAPGSSSPGTGYGTAPSGTRPGTGYGSAPAGSLPSTAYGAAPTSSVPSAATRTGGLGDGTEDPYRTGRRRVDDVAPAGRRRAGAEPGYDDPLPDPDAWRRDPADRRGRPGDDRDDDWRGPPGRSAGAAATEAWSGDEPAAWQRAEREDAARGSAPYRDSGAADWRRDLADQSDLAEGESRRYGTSDFVPFRSSGSAAVPGVSNLSMTSTSLIAPVREPDARPRRAGNGFQPSTGGYERRPVTGGLTASRRSDLLEPDDEEDEQESAGPLVAVGYTLGWYGVPVVLVVFYMLVFNSGSQSHALDTLGKAAPQFAVSLVLSVLVAVGLRWASSSWKAVSVGLAAAVVGGGLATVLTSAITGNSLS